MWTQAALRAVEVPEDELEEASRVEEEDLEEEEPTTERPKVDGDRRPEPSEPVRSLERPLPPLVDLPRRRVET